MESVISHLDTGACRALNSKHFLPAHQLPHLFEAAQNPLHPTSKEALSVMSQISEYYRNGARIATSQCSVLELKTLYVMPLHGVYQENRFVTWS